MLLSQHPYAGLEHKQARPFNLVVMALAYKTTSMLAPSNEEIKRYLEYDVQHGEGSTSS